jgi:uncharacterized protein with HEPN domain
MRNETRRRLLDALRSCEAISHYTEGLDFADYQHDAMVRDAVERRLGIIGEALNRLANSEPTIEEFVPELRHVIGLRNRVIHGYDDVDDQIVWEVVVAKLPNLQIRFQRLLAADDFPQSTSIP